MGHLGNGHCDGHPLMPQHGAEPSLPPPSRCGGASVASNESHRHPLGFRTQVFTRKMGNLFGGNACFFYVVVVVLETSFRWMCLSTHTENELANENYSSSRALQLRLALNSGTTRRSAKNAQNALKPPSLPHLVDELKLWHLPALPGTPGASCMTAGTSTTWQELPPAAPPD